VTTKLFSGHRVPAIRASVLSVVVAFVSTATMGLGGASGTETAPVAKRVVVAAKSTRVVKPKADAYVAAKKSTSNFGTKSTLRAASSPEQLVYLRFKVPHVDSTSRKVKLSLYVRQVPTSSRVFRVNSVSSSRWSEKTITYRNAPALGRNAVSFAARSGWITIDVSSVLVEGVGSLAVKSTKGGLVFSSRESGSHSPRLTVSAGANRSSARTRPRSRPATDVSTTTPTAPPPTPAPDTDTSPPTTSTSPPSTTTGVNRFGFSPGGTFFSESDSELARDLDAMAAAGSHSLRVDINWAVIQSAGSTSYDWAAFDRVVQAARQRGFDVLGMIGYTPSWALPAGVSGSMYAPANVSDYATFAATAAKRYAALGVHAYEIWNEPNIAAFWKPKPDPAAYAQLLKAAYAAIKAVDSQAVVLTGGTSPAATDGTNFAPPAFLQGLYANGAKGSFDAVAHHPYCWPASPGDTYAWSAWYQMYGTSPSLRSLMVANGDGDKQIWATEFGAPTNGPSGSFVSESDQAAMATKAYQLFASYSWAGPLFWYAPRDLGTDSGTRENFFGILRNDFSPKPAYAAYQAASAS
jgi:hypothetical protein